MIWRFLLASCGSHARLQRGVNSIIRKRDVLAVVLTSASNEVLAKRHKSWTCLCCEWPLGLGSVPADNDPAALRNRAHRCSSPIVSVHVKALFHRARDTTPSSSQGPSGSSFTVVSVGLVDASLTVTFLTVSPSAGNMSSLIQWASRACGDYPAASRVAIILPSSLHITE